MRIIRFRSSFNKCISKKILSDELKIAEVAQIFKKKWPRWQNQLTLLQLFYSKRYFTNKLKSCRKDPIAQTFKDCLTQNALLKLSKNWQNCLDKSPVAGTILVDLSEAYDCLPNGLRFAKLAAYGFDKTTLNVIQGYLSNWCQLFIK